MVSEIYLNYEKLRDKNHMTNYAVCKRAGVSKATMTKWKHGLAKPSLNSLEKLSAYFDVPVNYFYEG